MSRLNPGQWEHCVGSVPTVSTNSRNTSKSTVFERSRGNDCRSSVLDREARRVYCAGSISAVSTARKSDGSRTVAGSDLLIVLPEHLSHRRGELVDVPVLFAGFAAQLPTLLTRVDLRESSTPAGRFRHAGSRP
jgi:hypothetical protein